MAGIEQIVIHAKSYVVRWIQVPEQQSISWSVEPHKKSINFGIFKHPGTKGGLTPALPTHDTLDGTPSLPPTPGLDGFPQVVKRGRHGSVGKSDESTAVTKLESIGLKKVAWTGKCEADKVAMGRYDVLDGEGGTYGMVFDNTFSRNTSKTVHFVLMTHPTNAPPKSGHHLHYSQAFAANSTSTIGKNYSPSLQPITDSNEDLPESSPLHRPVLEDPRPASKGGRGTETKGLEGSSFYTGVLNKKRRKKGQGYAKRFFSLDFTSSTLSYYRDRHSSALRGAVPLSLAAVGVDEKSREFSIDSGAEVWHLKAPNRRDFDGWRDALERAASAVIAVSEPATPAKSLGTLPRPPAPNPVEDREWQMVEQLVSKVSGTRDAVRGLAKDTDPKYLPGVNGVGLGLTNSGGSGSSAPSPSSYEASNPYFPENIEGGLDRRPFWKRKPSAERSPAALFRRSVSAQLAVPSSSCLPTPLSPTPSQLNVQKRPSLPQVQVAEDVHDRCMALLNDLDSVVANFSALIAESKARRMPALPTSGSRMSLESIDNDEFFDAEDGGGSPSQLLHIRRSEDEATMDDHEHGSDAESDTSSEIGDEKGKSPLFSTPKNPQNALFPSVPKTLPPLPLPPAKRRITIAPPKQPPPSIIGFLRKNAGKDLSTVTMPVTANEPTSLLQRLAESLEYPQLLDSAASSSTTPTERLMYVTAFALSYFSNNRVKERAIRKPFNPMLGETYELVREDLGFRFVAEKVSHHPVRMACQAESLNNGGWCFTQSPQPIQKFWGKSVELNTEGRARVILHGPNERYSWSQATCFLRNVIAGEKYVEPVQTMTVHCETSGMRAVATFKAGGMFSGRSEEVSVQLFGPQHGDAALDVELLGKWTEGLKRTDTGASIWTVGELAPNAAKVYGFTAFAAALNEVTAVEAGHLPPTDSRLRPDQLALEKGDVDKAEGLKAKLEERQRARRKVLEGHGQQWKSLYFAQVAEGDDEVWMLKENGGYWERRAKGDWKDVQEVFEL
ncbi:Oxysterol-binding protein 3 [Elasticomyces elasticus]|nr:Oxysterol-binding protein 3 [Elasticomyces elasticus]KAK4973457.1 Oxysterol-binding protein 3 [Elasticomyces elasticus]